MVQEQQLRGDKHDQPQSEPSTDDDSAAVSVTRTASMVNVLDGFWKTRVNRHENNAEKTASSMRTIIANLVPDIHFAFGNYKGGGLLG